MEKETKTILSRTAAVAAIVFFFWFVGTHCDSGDAGMVDGGLAPVPVAQRREPQKRTPAEDWHRATNKVEVALRIKDRLERELEELGLDPSNLLANAKAHPTQLVRSVPEHPGRIGRLRLLVLSKEDEAKLARSVVEDCRRKGRLADADDPPGMIRVERIVGRLVPVVREIERVPEVHLLRDDSVNAFCLPDGTVFVNTGTLRAVSDDGLLAAILAHELGHAAARHGNEGVSRALKVAAAGVVAEEGMAGLAPVFDSGAGVSAVRLLYGIGSDAAYTCPRDRRMENEADRLGTRYLARAGYDPEEMARLLEWFGRIDPEDGDKKGFLQLFRSHPFHSERLGHVREVLQEPDLGQPLGPTLEDRIDGWKDDAAGIATNLPAGMPPVVTNLPSAVPGMMTNLISRLPGGGPTNRKWRLPRPGSQP